jgi:hypothetical protein
LRHRCVHLVPYLSVGRQSPRLELNAEVMVMMMMMMMIMIIIIINIVVIPS